MRKQSQILVSTLLALFVAAAGCDKKEAPTAAGAPPSAGEKDTPASYSVAYSSVGDPNPWFVAFTAELEKEAQKRGVKFSVAHAQAKIEKQFGDVEDLLAKKPDVLILGPIDVKGSAACLGVAKEAGVPVVVVNRDIAGTPGADYVTRIYSDFVWIGAKQLEVVHDALGADTPIKVVELHGTAGGGNTLGLQKGLREQMKKYKDAEIVASQPGDYNRATALKAMENIVQAMAGKFNAVIGHSDEEGIAAVQALKAAGIKVGNGKDGSVIVVSAGGTKDALTAIKAGELFASVTVSPYYAAQVFDAVEKFKKGEKLTDYIRVDDFVIDQANVAKHESFGF